MYIYILNQFKFTLGRHCTLELWFNRGPGLFLAPTGYVGRHRGCIEPLGLGIMEKKMESSIVTIVYSHKL